MTTITPSSSSSVSAPLNVGPARAKMGLTKTAIRTFLEVDVPDIDCLPNPKEERARFRAVMREIELRSYVIIGLVLANIVLQPFLRPTLHYMAMTPKREVMPIVGLFESNQTDQAILSWAATGITEIMTLGFGDFDARLLSQRSRFTKDGWRSFVDALVQQNLREGFKTHQLVLTSVPTDTPVIISKGIFQDKEGQEEPVYRWIVEMPVIMTYLTNNNVSTARKGIVRLTIVRVPSYENVTGIGVKTWRII